MIGRTLAHYEILEEISRGGMGVVYKAFDPKLQREVAIKVLPQELVSDPERKRRFVQEARAAAALNHPHIATIFDIVEAEGISFIVMELIEGEQLRELLARETLTVDRALSLAIDTTEGLVRAHEKGIVHRDLKPANIMVTEDGRPKIIDFGLAKLVETRPNDPEAETAVQKLAGLTKPGLVMGTVSYMSPEQARAESVDHRTDIFTLGIILYEMVTGQLPFLGQDQVAVWDAICSKTPIPAGKLRKDVSPELDRVIARALEKRPEDRYQTATELLTDLRRVRRESESSIQVDRPAARTRRLTAAAIAAGVVAITVLVLWGGRAPRAPQVEQTTQLTLDPGPELDPALSPDGKMIAYAAGPFGQMSIYVQQVAGGRPLRLAQDIPGNHRWPQWSPDGSRIAFTSWVGERQSEIYVVPALGGVARRLIEARSDEVVFGIAWSPDGTHIAYFARQGSSGVLYVAPAEGGEPRKVSTGIDVFPLSWSPDGDTILYAQGNSVYMTIGNMAVSSLWAVSSSGGDPVQLTSGAHIDQSPLWAPDGTRVLFVSDRGGGRDIYQMEFPGSGTPVASPVRVTTGLNVHTISLSADGTRLAYSVLNSRSNLWSIPIPTDGPVSIHEAAPVTRGNQIIESGAVSPDGKWLAFDSNRSGNPEIYKMPLDGGEAQQLTNDPAPDFLPTWSPDGQRIAFQSQRTGNRDLFVMSADGGPARQLTDAPGFDSDPEWSIDGRLFFNSDRAGEFQIYSLSADRGELDGEDAQQLTTDGGVGPIASPDGRLVAYDSPDGLSVISTDGTDRRTLVSRNGRSDWQPRWSPDGSTIFGSDSFYGGHPSSTGFWAVPISSGQPKLLVRFDDPSRIRMYPRFGSDGRKFYFSLTEFESDLWLMELSWDDAGSE